MSLSARREEPTVSQGGVLSAAAPPISNVPYICASCQMKNIASVVPLVNNSTSDEAQVCNSLAQLSKPSAGKNTNVTKVHKTVGKRKSKLRFLSRCRGKSEDRNLSADLKELNAKKRRLILHKSERRPQYKQHTMTSKIKSKLEYNNPFISGRTLDHYIKYGKPPFFNFGSLRNVKVCRY